MLEAYAGQSASVDGGVQDDGRRLWIFSQTRFKQVDTCPERGRRSLLGLTPDGPSDSTAVGQAVHGAIELCVTDMIDGQGPWAASDMLDVAVDIFNANMAEPNARWVRVKRPETAYGFIDTCLATWRREVMPTLHPWAVEVTFGPLTVYEDEQRIIQIRGQIDYIDQITELADWKTSGREWEPWEHQRWDVQPTLYTLGYYLHLFGGDPDWLRDEYGWTWHVLRRDGGYQKIRTVRTPADWDWLIRRLVVTAEMLEANLPRWPLNDTSALCSPDWCPAWPDCKGAHMPDNWPLSTKG